MFAVTLCVQVRFVLGLWWELFNESNETGQEHQADPNGVAHPSYCTLDVLHQPLASQQPPPGGAGYVTRDGHHFTCRNPAQMQQAFHV